MLSIEPGARQNKNSKAFEAMLSSRSSIVAIVYTLFLVPFISSPVTAQTYVDSWYSGCAALISNVTDWQLADGFVDANGNRQKAFDNTTTWGITKEKCDEVCSGSALRSVGARALRNNTG